MVKKKPADYHLLQNAHSFYNINTLYVMKKNIIFTCIVPFIMLIFFCRNLVLVETEHLDSWMGGGMRMFGKIDKMLYRTSGFTVDYNNKTYFVNLRNIKALEDVDVGLRILPNNKRLIAALNTIKSHNWYYNPLTDAIEFSKFNNGTNDTNILLKNFTVKDVRVYKTHFNPNNKEISLQLLNSYSHD